MKGIFKRIGKNYEFDSGDYFLIFLLILIAVGCIIWLSVRLRENKKYKIFNNIKYFFLAFMMGVIIGLIGYGNMQESGGIWFFICVILMIGAGALHVWRMLKKYRWSQREGFLNELLFTITVACIGGLGFMLMFNGADTQEVHRAFTLNCFLVPIPWLMLKAYDLWNAVPQPQYDYWLFDPLAGRQDFTNLPSQRMSFQLSRIFQTEGHDSRHIITDNLQVAIEKPLEDVFQVWLMDYNSAPARKLRPIKNLEKDSAGKKIGWLFYTLPTTNVNNRQYLDFTKSLVDNGIEKSQIIYAERHILPASYMPKKSSGIIIKRKRT